MEILVLIKKTKKMWEIEIPFMSLYTCGHTKTEAIEMLMDLLVTALKDHFGTKFSNKQTSIKILDRGKGMLGIEAKDMRPLLSFALYRQREESHLTIQQAAKRLGSIYPNAYAKYEKGNINITLNQYNRLIHAVNPNKGLVLSVA